MDAHFASLLKDIGLGIVFAAVFSHLARLMRQPAILGYVAGGLVLGPHLGFALVTNEASIELISEIGLIFLLFIIGLEINLRDLVQMGRSMAVMSVGQFVGCALVTAGFFSLAGSAFLTERFDLLYLAVVLSLSSTLIVVKVLHDKFEIHTTAGRMTVGILVLQDLWAIVFMGVQPNLLHPQAGIVLRAVLSGGLLVGFAFAVARFVLAGIFRAAGKQPELVLLTAVAWCFFLCGLADYAGLSREMGALIAGLTIAAFPYGVDVIAKIGGVRDFFVTLFFVSLGLKMPQPSLALTSAAFMIAAVVLVSRLVTLIPLSWVTGTGLRMGILTGLNLAQISEFSLVILALGAGYGHVSSGIQSLVLLSMLLTSVLATYLILYNAQLAGLILTMIERLGLHESGHADERHGAPEDRRDIVVLGCFREGEALLDLVAERAPELSRRILVVDYNPLLERKLSPKGFRWVYGDLAHPETLEHLGIEHAATIICPISDTFLKGTTAQRLLRHVKQLAPSAALVMTADDEATAAALQRAGAAYIIRPPRLAADHLFALLAGASSLPS
ncbi:MAG TPA: cation:proton antiporter [Candidatus Binatia bacterium]|nr:cation:proton antiporter [Candidatus Binatia bacterium]